MTDLRMSDLLHAEHQRTLAVLGRLDQVCAAATAPAPENLEPLLADLAAVCEGDISRHYAFEEEHLFPKLAAGGADFMTEMLAGEHRVIRPLAEQLKSMSEQPAAAFTDEAWSAFRALANEFVERETFHIQKEEMGLINALNMMLGAEEDARLVDLYRERSAGAG